MDVTFVIRQRQQQLRLEQRVLAGWRRPRGSGSAISQRDLGEISICIKRGACLRQIADVKRQRLPQPNGTCLLAGPQSP